MEWRCRLGRWPLFLARSGRHFCQYGFDPLWGAAIADNRELELHGLYSLQSDECAVHPFRRRATTSDVPLYRSNHHTRDPPYDHDGADSALAERAGCLAQCGGFADLCESPRRFSRGRYAIYLGSWERRQREIEFRGKWFGGFVSVSVDRHHRGHLG